MPFVQDNTTPITANTQTTSVASDTAATSSGESAATPSASPVIVPAAEVAAEAKSELKTEAKPAGAAVTETKAVSTRLEPGSSSDGLYLWMWLPLAVMMGIWLYLRGRNQAAERARADALLATAAKKSKKSARSQTAEYRADDESNSLATAAGERSGKGNSKKNKKDKQQQKKKQQANSAVATAKANRIAPSATESVKPISATAHEASVATATVTAPERKTVAPIPQAAKAIFEPLRKVTSPAPVDNAESEFESDESLERESTPSRKRRPSPPPPVVITPAKVSSGRFEKLNLPPANAGLGASAANRWPTEAASPITARAPQSVAPRADSSTAQSARSVAPAPVTARGLGAFVKVAKPTEATESPAMDATETQAESSNP